VSRATSGPSRTRSSGPHARAFVTTHWSIVLAAGQSNSVHAQAALSKLCQTYWYPLYAYVRQRGYSSHDSQDLTQDFFARLLEKNTLGVVTRDKGRFRSFLLTALNHFLADEWRKEHAQKRGGGQILPLDLNAAETRFRSEPTEPAETTTPEKVFEQNWALALLNTVFERLRDEYQSDGKSNLFETLKFCLTGERSTAPYAELAAQLKLPENTVKVAVHRLRRRYRELLREEVSHTVERSGEVEQELQYLFRVLSS
jgi:RNA polymerase sigma-70 factor (ECF subfamily)